MNCAMTRRCSDLRIHIPPEQRDKFLDPCCEIEPDFLCFEENYVPVAEIVPKNYRIIDLGCYMAAQAFLFQDHAAYVGVDCFDIQTGKKHDGYYPPRRFSTDNSIMFYTTIQEFIRKFDLLGWNKDECYVICSGVPDFEATMAAVSFFTNIACFYPGRESVIKGCFCYPIRERRKKFLMQKLQDAFEKEETRIRKE